MTYAATYAACMTIARTIGRALDYSAHPCGAPPGVGDSTLRLVGELLASMWPFAVGAGLLVAAVSRKFDPAGVPSDPSGSTTYVRFAQVAPKSVPILVVAVKPNPKGSESTRGTHHSRSGR
jgi:hypothetical protein